MIPPDSIPGRMALLITLFLVLINLFSSILSYSPTAEAMTAISSWMLVCLLFVFGALIGYAGLLVLLYGSTEKVEPIEKTMYPSETADELILKVRRIDRILLYTFMALFLLFNFVYWPLVV